MRVLLENMPNSEFFHRFRDGVRESSKNKLKCFVDVLERKRSCHLIPSLHFALSAGLSNLNLSQEYATGLPVALMTQPPRRCSHWKTREQPSAISLLAWAILKIPAVKVSARQSLPCTRR